MNQRQVGFVEAIRMGFNKYAQFGGRSSRSEYWWWYLFTLLVSCAIDAIFGIDTTDSLVISTIVGLVFLIPGLAITCRRLHDIGKGAGWIFIVLVPLVGWIWLIVLLCTPSEPIANRFGDVPNEIA